MMGRMASNDDLLFGEHAVKGGYLTEAQVRESLGVQERMAEMGIAESLSNVLVKRGVMREGDAALVARAAGLRSGREPIPGYTLRARVGSGAMGSVYRATQRAMKRDVAIKILRRDLTDDPRQVQRLQREATLVGTLDHPNIVRGLDCGESDGLVYFVMEFVEGRTLHQRIRKEGPIPVDEAVTLTRKIAEALQHAHEHGVVHRDIKPGNILLTTEDEPRLTDYGLAKVESDDALTQLDATLGTPQYIAPEQARNPRDVDVRSDIYSLGATLYAMLAGHPPFQAETLAATLTKVLYERPMPIAEAAEDVPPELAYVVERMMAKDRRHRYETPQDLVVDLKALEAGRLHVPAGFRGDIEAFVETRRQRRVWIIGSALLAVGALAAIGTLAWREERDRAAAQQAARDDLVTILLQPGDREDWDGGTVARMIVALDVHLAAHPGGTTQSEAHQARGAWHRQRDAIETVQRLQMRASQQSEPDWPRLLADLRAEQTRLTRGRDADVALRRLRTIVDEVEQARSRRARELVRLAREEAGNLSLLDAAARLEAVAETLRDALFGLGSAPEADAVAADAADFREARTTLDAHFAAYESAASDAELVTADLRKLEDSLQRSTFAAQDDEELMELLAELPPKGGRRDEITVRRAREVERLRGASVRRMREALREAEDRVARREHAKTEGWLDAVGELLLGDERDQLDLLRDSIAEARQIDERELARTIESAGREFIDALFRRDYREASIALEGLEVFTVGWAKNDGPAEWLVTQGRQLLDLIKSRAWDALRARLSSGRPLELGIDVGSGIRYQDVRDVRVVGDQVMFSYGGGESHSASIHNLDLDDVLHYAGLPGHDANGALVAAALRIVETPEQLPAYAPHEAQERMREVGPVIEQARQARGFEYVVERLDARRRRMVSAAAAVLADREDEAQSKHESAQRALEDGRFEVARTLLDELLTDRIQYKTDYVLARRSQISSEHARSLEGRETERYAHLLPGARLEDGPGGTAVLTLDFEDAGAGRAFSAESPAGAIQLRHEISADHPGASGEEFPVVDNHVFAWKPWDGEPDHLPSLYPFAMDIPFDVRRRVEVAFLYRSDTPFFLQVAIGGTTVGILSAPDVREAGRGVAIWQSATLGGADAHFGKRHRSDYLARHPEVLEKEGDTRFFAFEPGRLYRVRFVKHERKAALFIDGRRVFEEDLRPGVSAGELEGKLLIASHTSGEFDDVRISGVLDPDWLKRRPK